MRSRSKGTCWAIAVLASGLISRPVLARGVSPRADRLEQRVALLSKALALDARQQLEVRKILQDQRAEVRKVWADASLVPARRVLATQAIGEQTTDRIRALLNEQQKKRFKPPRQPYAAPAGSPSVEEWMRAGKQK